MQLWMWLIKTKAGAGAFVASLKFNDARNSQYIPVMTGIGSI